LGLFFTLRHHGARLRIDSMKSGLMKSSWSKFEDGFNEKWSHEEFMKTISNNTLRNR
jgi:hypothetical protein